MTRTKAALVGALALAASGLVGNREAAAQQRWCVWYDAYTYTCGFRSLEQCAATAHGAGGVCRLDYWATPKRAPETADEPAARPSKKKRRPPPN